MEKDFLVQGLIVFDHLQMHNYKHLHVETLQWLVQSGLLTVQQTKEPQEVAANLFLQTQVLSKKKKKKGSFSSLEHMHDGTIYRK